VLGDPKRLTAIVVDESDQHMLLGTFEALLNLPEGFLVPEEDAPNRSLTAGPTTSGRVRPDRHQQRRPYPVAQCP
jgi:hypothetical protein